jgi:hypothetical protein
LKCFSPKAEQKITNAKKEQIMTKSLVRLSLLGVLLVAIAIPALAHRGSVAQATNAAVKMVAVADAPTLVADSSPIPWPKPTTTTKPPANAVGLPTLLADGFPIPWPKPTTPTKPPANAVGLPTLLADGFPIPWPKPTTTSEPPANAVGLPTLLADGFPIPWPKPTTTTVPPANAIA